MTKSSEDIVEVYFHKRLSAEYPEYIEDIDQKSIEKYLNEINELIY